ncbi:MAG: hypothetical protein GY913_30485 [Proteobacteria bacterium]|nr:hypothetical protein [Pseudomonadota bacterium]MCP4921245.1 hypothetical protein [Pseudomonadota bacterium]
MLFALTLTALAAPDRIATDLADAGGTTLSWMLADDDNQIVALIEEGSSQLRVVDLQTWGTHSVAVCDGPAGLASWSDDSGVLRLAVGCASGDVDIVTFDDRDPAIESTASLSTSAILGLAVSADTLWAVVDAEDLTVEGIATADYALSDYTSTLARSGFNDIVGGTSYVFVVHGDDDISRFHSTSGGTTASNENLGSRDFVRATPQIGNDSNLFLADANGGLLTYQSGSDELSIVVDDDDGLTGTSSVVIDPGAEWIALGDGTQVQLHEYDNGGVDTEPFAEFSLDGAVATDLVATSGYLFAATDGGRLLVMTEYPWLEFDSAPGDLVTGDEFTLAFSSDTEGDWTMNLDGPTGTELASGTIEADATASVDFTADETWTEGGNRVWVTLDEGYDAIDVVVDNPPPKPVISVGFGDSKVVVDITAAGVADLDRYEIYISSEEFARSDYESGGPEGTDPESPIEVTSEDPDEDVSVTIDELTNGVTYHVAVRVIDEAGTEGEMSKVHLVTPEETYGVAYLAGESECSSTGAAAPIALLGLAGALLLRRRKWAAGLAIGLGLVVSSPAQAADEGGWQSKSRTNELHVGPASMEDAQNTTSNEAWADTYGQTGLTYLRFDGGRQFYRVVELDGGIGLLRKSGNTVTDAGEASAEGSKITAIPISAGLTVRLDPTARIKDEWRGMPVVPYVGAGLEYTLWRERLGDIDPADPFTNSTYSGGLPSWYWHAGADILLDWMDPRRASVAEARWGITDTYLTIEYADRTTIYRDGVGGLSFAGDTLTVGLKIDRK